MSRLAFPTVIVTLLLALATTSAMSTLTHFENFSAPHLTEQALITGQAHRFYMAAETWRRFPDAPRPVAAFIDLRAMTAMAALIATIVVVGRVRRRASFTTIGLLCLLSAAIPYSAGMIALRRNIIPDHAGPWLMTMLLSALYGSLACAVLAALDTGWVLKITNNMRRFSRRSRSFRAERIAPPDKTRIES